MIFRKAGSRRVAPKTWLTQTIIWAFGLPIAAALCASLLPVLAKVHPLTDFDAPQIPAPPTDSPASPDEQTSAWWPLIGSVVLFLFVLFMQLASLSKSVVLAKNLPKATIHVRATVHKVAVLLLAGGFVMVAMVLATSEGWDSTVFRWVALALVPALTIGAIPIVIDARKEVRLAEHDSATAQGREYTLSVGE